MSISAHFARDYSEARAKFRDAATQAGAKITSYREPAARPQRRETLHGHGVDRADGCDTRVHDDFRNAWR